MELTPGLSINVGDFALDDGSVQETLVRDPQALGSLVLITFTRFLRGSYGLERCRGHCVVENPVDRVSVKSQGTDRVESDGMLYDFPVRLSMTVRESVLAPEVVGCPIVDSFGQSRGRTRIGWKWELAGDLVLPRSLREQITVMVDHTITCFALNRFGLRTRSGRRLENQASTSSWAGWAFSGWR